jgi:transposase
MAHFSMIVLSITWLTFTLSNSDGKMARKFIDVDYEATLEMRVRIGDVLPGTHLARFIVAIIERLDMSSFYAHYGEQGAPGYAPEMLLGIVVHG